MKLWKIEWTMADGQSVEALMDTPKAFKMLINLKRDPACLFVSVKRFQND